jgi:hypothetical protein
MNVSLLVFATLPMDIATVLSSVAGTTFLQFKGRGHFSIQTNDQQPCIAAISIK